MTRTFLCLLATLCLIPSARAEAPSALDRTVAAVERGAQATANGIERGAKAAARGIEIGLHATERGIRRGAEATANAAEKVTKKVTGDAGK